MLGFPFAYDNDSNFRLQITIETDTEHTSSHTSEAAIDYHKQIPKSEIILMMTNNVEKLLHNLCSVCKMKEGSEWGLMRRTRRVLGSHDDGGEREDEGKVKT